MGEAQLAGLADFLRQFHAGLVLPEGQTEQETEEGVPEEEESSISTLSFVDDQLTKLQAILFTTVIQESLNKIKILGLIGGLPTVYTTLDAPTVLERLDQEDTQSFIFDPDTLEPYEGSIKKQMLIKFQKDRSLIELVLEEALEDITTNFGLNLFIKRLKRFTLEDEQRATVLGSNKKNVALLKDLSEQMLKDKSDLSHDLQEKTETLGRLKDQYEDLIYENDIKYRYIDRWERARCAQNLVDMNKKEDAFVTTIKEYTNNAHRENRIHLEIEAYLTETENTHRNDIEKWMDKYDRDLDAKEIDIQFMREKREEQMNNLNNLAQLYADHKREIEEYLVVREERNKERELLERMNRAATKIQAWWRGVMYRRGLGPYKKRKGKKGKGHDKKKKK